MFESKYAKRISRALYGNDPKEAREVQQLIVELRKLGEAVREDARMMQAVQGLLTEEVDEGRPDETIAELLERVDAPPYLLAWLDANPPAVLEARVARFEELHGEAVRRGLLPS